MPAQTLSIGCRLYLQYCKIRKTTYMTQFLSMSYDYGLLILYLCFFNRRLTKNNSSISSIGTFNQFIFTYNFNQISDLTSH